MPSWPYRPLSPSILYIFDLLNLTLQVALSEGFYSVYMADWLKVWPREQMLFLRYEDYGGHEVEIVNKVATHLGISEYENRKLKMHKGKFILSSQEQCPGPRFKVSSEGLSPEIYILIRSPIPVLTEAAVAKLDSIWRQRSIIYWTKTLIGAWNSYYELNLIVQGSWQ